MTKNSWKGEQQQQQQQQQQKQALKARAFRSLALKKIMSLESLHIKKFALYFHKCLNLRKFW